MYLVDGYYNHLQATIYNCLKLETEDGLEHRKGPTVGRPHHVVG